MKKNLGLLMIGLTALAASSALAQRVTVFVHHDRVEFEGQRPVMRGDRVMVPLRGVLEKMGVHVDWDAESETVTARRGDTHVKLHVGDNTASVNGKPFDLDVPALIIHGSTMVPLRFIGESMGERVHWNAETYTVNIDRGEGGDMDMADHGDHPRDHGDHPRDHGDRPRDRGDRNPPRL